MADEDRIKSAINEARVLGLNAADDRALGELFTEYFADDSTSSSDSSDMSDSESDIDMADVEEHVNVEDHEYPPEHDSDDEPIIDVNPVFQLIDNVGMDDWISPDAEDDLQKVRDFHRCTCRHQSCLTQFDEDFIVGLRQQMSDASLSKAEKKLFLLGKISTTLNNSASTSCKKRSGQKNRQRSRTQYLVEGNKVCRETFLFMHHISNNLLMGLTKHYKCEGAVPPRTKSGGRSNARALPKKKPPQPIPPPGLTAKRSEYLHQHIREFCTPQTCDITCPPPPAVSTSGSSDEECSDEECSSSSSDDAEVLPQKRLRIR